jgi:two-component system cell cycle sensor histidine kinase/response regulator CckA
MTPSGPPRRDPGVPADAAARAGHSDDAASMELSPTLGPPSDTPALEARIQAERLDAAGRLAGGVAHAFNNLLTAIIGFTELALRRTDLHADVRVDLLEVAKAAQTAASITGALQAFGGGQVLRPRPVALNDVVHCVEPLARRLMGDHVTVTLDLEPVPLVHADPAQLEHVLLHLLAHAAECLPEGGRIAVQTRLSDAPSDTASSQRRASPRPYVIVAVTHDGAALDEGARAHVFEPFSATGMHGRGHELRLASVYGIVRQSGGAIDVASRSGGGTTFRVWLPVWDDAHR